MTVFGWDASNFDLDRDGNGVISMRAVAADGITFVTHKATEGTRTIHDNFGRIMRDARDAGIAYLGAYIVPRTPGNSGHGSISAQVDYFLRYVTDAAPWWRDFPGWFWQVDTEEWSANGKVYDAVSAATGAETCRQLRERTGRQVIHYAPRWAYGDGIPGNDPLWASDYVVGSGPYRKLYPGDQSGRWVKYSNRVPTILQYSSRTIIGEQNTCDANAFRGSLTDWHRLITGRELDDMALKDDPDGKWEYPRVEAMARLQPPSSGPEIGQVLPFVQWTRDVTAALKELQGRAPATFTAAQIADLGAAIVGHDDTPLGPDDQPAIVAALDSYFRRKLGT